MTQIDVEIQHRRLRLEDHYRRFNAQYRIWRLCVSAKCRRVGRCRGDIRLCALRLGDWAKVLRLPPKRELSSDELEARALLVKAFERIAEKWRSLDSEEAACPARSMALSSEAKDNVHAALDQEPDD